MNKRPEEDFAPVSGWRHESDRPEGVSRAVFVDADALPSELYRHMLGKAGLSLYDEPVRFVVRERTPADPRGNGMPFVAEARSASDMDVPRGLPIPPSPTQRVGIEYSDPDESIPPFGLRLKGLFKRVE